MKINRLRTAFAAVLFGLVLILGGQSAKAETKDVSGTARYDHAFQVLELVNQERAKVSAVSPPAARCPVKILQWEATYFAAHRRR